MHHPPSRALPRAAMPALALSATLLAACAPLQTRDNLRAANAIVQPRIGQEAQLWTDAEAQQQAQSRIDALLREPLSADAAVRIALLGSPALQMLLAQNAAQSAASTRSARLSNPVLGLERLLQGGSVEIDRFLSIGLLDLVTLPARGRIDAARQQQLRLDLARDVLRLAAQARTAWVRALAAQQALQYDNDVEDAASATAELAKRMQAAGNFTKLDAAQQALFAADSRMRAQRAHLAALRAREALVRTLGLDAAQAAKIRLPEHLPAIPAVLHTAKQETQEALEARLDVQVARAQYEAAARTAGFVRTTSVVDALELTGIRKTSSDATPQNGFALALPLPVFDLGDARRAEAGARVLAARNRVAEAAVNAASQLRGAWAARDAAWALARTSRQQVAPLAQTVLDENQQRYNGMLIGVFQLVSAASAQAQAVREVIAAERDYWLAEADWQAAQWGVEPPIGSLSDSTTTAAPSPSSSGGH
ncbi:outer membrane efflux protein [mine drainage metagenome]|uniref:Outer membrane efflux protein n=1 Tax=mine drainage metagenome TaxID=410659 RepID=A0A1J5RQ94_9ZZZZ